MSLWGRTLSQRCFEFAEQAWEERNRWLAAMDEVEIGLGSPNEELKITGGVIGHDPGHVFL